MDIYSDDSIKSEEDLRNVATNKFQITASSLYISRVKVNKQASLILYTVTTTSKRFTA